MGDDERVRSDAFVSFMYFSEVRCATVWVLEGHWITAAPRPLDVIRARLSPSWRSFNKEGHQEENNLSLYITMSVYLSVRVHFCSLIYSWRWPLGTTKLTKNSWTFVDTQAVPYTYLSSMHCQSEGSESLTSAVIPKIEGMSPVHLLILIFLHVKFTYCPLVPFPHAKILLPPVEKEEENNI